MRTESEWPRRELLWDDGCTDRDRTVEGDKMARTCMSLGGETE